MFGFLCYDCFFVEERENDRDWVYEVSEDETSEESVHEPILVDYKVLKDLGVQM